MTAPAPRLSALFWGTSLAYVRRHPPANLNFNIDALTAAIEDSEKAATTNPAFSGAIYYADPDDVSTLQSLQDLIKNGDPREKKPWDIIVIGFGVRANPGLTGFFEEYVNFIREETNARIAFNSGPYDHLEPLRRKWPELGL